MIGCSEILNPELLAGIIEENSAGVSRHHSKQLAPITGGQMEMT
jgi:hypothetical protein